MTGDITLADSAGADLDLDGKVLIDGSVTIDTDNTTNDGTISFETTIDGADGTGDNLTILAGDNDGDGTPGGALTLSGSIGDTTALSTLKINATAGDIALTIPQVGGGGAAGVTGQVDIGNSNTASISMGSDTYDFGSGNVTLTGNTTFTQATPTVDMINASGDGGDFTITGTLTLNNGLLDVNTKGGNIEITGNITSAGVDEALTLDDGTGTGTITLGGTVSTGDITLIGDLSLIHI